MEAISMCVECSALLDDSRDQRKHMGRLIERCLPCGRHGLCPDNLEGTHDVRWPEDPMFDAKRLQIGPLPDGVRTGFCSGCLQEFIAQGDGTFRDLNWEDVGILWARAQGDVPGRIDVMVQQIDVYDGIAAMESRVTVQLMDPLNRDLYAVVESTPFPRDGQMMRLIDALGFREGDHIDLGPNLVGKTLSITIQDGEIIGFHRKDESDAA